MIGKYLRKNDVDASQIEREKLILKSYITTAAHVWKT